MSESKNSGVHIVHPEPDSATYRTLLESTKAIPWKITWATLEFSYIGPQIEELLGWERESWVGINDWAERMHPEDRDRVVNFCVAQSKSGTDHEADYRALTKNGDYVWIRDVVHVVRDEKTGEVDSLIGFMFDITERKRIEEKLVALQKELEELSYKDGLTGVANRRMFDSVVDVEWASARRNSQALSVALVDIDHFKEYNDHYGHVQGDDCLKQVARLLESAASRPRDFLGRYGGEEFVLVLPETGPDAALAVAERCRQIVREAAIPHAASDAASVVTVSVGVGTIVPRSNDDLTAFIESVDRQLYAAKLSGRNTTVADAQPAES
ncbi:sensor domain-containing diguanylate cyclase [Proteobacteria bacterium 005FR1]|nr:sensor domain-containing diguanylate cyclase [Proteobacteria bacterium 005FR1]